MSNVPQPSPGRLLIEATRAHRAVFAAELTKVGLHVGQELVLMEVGRDNGLTQALLTQRLGVERATVSRALTRLERSGFVRRDERGSSVHIMLTPAGRKALPAIRALWQRVDQELSAAAGPDLAGMVAGLERVRARLKADVDYQVAKVPKGRPSRRTPR